MGLDYTVTQVDLREFAQGAEGKITALIDADSIIYMMGWTFRDQIDDVESVVEATRTYIKDILRTTQARQFAGYMSCHREVCYRRKYCLTYKQKRDGSEEPEWLTKLKPVIEAVLIKDFGFVKLQTIEADDAVSLVAGFLKGKNYVVCSPDKDLKQIPGNHYNYKKQERAVQDEDGAHLHFYQQVLSGDTTDGIPGCKGIGVVKAKQILDGIPAEDREDIVFQHYQNKHPDDFLERYLLTKGLIELLRYEKHGLHSELHLAFCAVDLDSLEREVFDQLNS